MQIAAGEPESGIEVIFQGVLPRVPRVPRSSQWLSLTADGRMMVLPQIRARAKREKRKGKREIGNEMGV